MSGGEKKKVSLATILSYSPQVWLLDEPSAGLDPRSASWLIDFITSPENIKKTIILATHDLGFAEAVAHRGYVLDENHHSIADGAINDILNNQKLLLNSNLVRY